MLFDFGFDPTFARNVAYVWSGATELSKNGAVFAKSSEKINTHLFIVLIRTCRFIYARIAIIAVIILGVFGSLYLINVVTNFSRLTNIIAWSLFCVSLGLNLYMGYYSALLRGIGKISEINKALIASRSTQFLVTVALLFLNGGLIAATFGFFVNGICFRVLCRRFFFKDDSIFALNAKIDVVQKSEVTSLYRIISVNAFQDGQVAISSFITTQITALLAPLYLTITQVAAYSISIQLATALVSASAAYINTYHPAFQSAYLKNDLQTQQNIFKHGFCIYYTAVLIGLIGISIAVIPFLMYLKPQLKIDYDVFWVLSLYMILWQQQSIGASLIADTNKIPYVRAFKVSAVLGLLMIFLFCQYLNMGIWGLVLGPLLIQLSYNNWKWVLVVFRRLYKVEVNTYEEG